MQVLEHLSAELVERYRRRQLEPSELLDAQAHADACVDCRARLERAAGLDSAFESLRADLSGSLQDSADEPEHLPYEQLAAFADGQLDEVDSEIAESHFAVCQACTDDLADLRRYKAIAEAPPARAPQSLRQRLFAFLPAFSFGGMQAVAAVAAFAVLLLGVWLAVRRERGTDGVESARVEPVKRNITVPTPQPAPPSSRTSGVVNADSPTPQGDGNSSKPSNDDVQSTTDARTRHQPAVERAKPQSPPDSPPDTYTLADGEVEVAYDSRGNLRGLEELPASVRLAVRDSLRRQKVAVPRTLDALKGGSGVLMSGAATAQSGVPFALLSPVGKVVRSDRPAFRWRALEGADGYTVAVVDANFKQVAQSPKLSATEWTPPTPLRRGAIYFWQVTANSPDGGEVTSPAPTAPQAKFQVLDERALGELRLMEQSGSKSHLARGTLYAGAGLLDEARAEFEKLVEQNPRSRVARRLLQSVR